MPKAAAAAVRQPYPEPEHFQRGGGGGEDNAFLFHYLVHQIGVPRQGRPLLHGRSLVCDQVPQSDVAVRIGMFFFKW
ncbi:unnamed protein product [Linum trigynum]|uniref:Uncharacterized protein n=1 Tax=Linum trigynum TaxID=586398 RepID=A0AAV2FG54_9ROSI